MILATKYNCPCCSGKQFSDCCQPFLTGNLIPTTPEALIRSRFVAYTMGNISYIQQTMRGRAAINFNASSAEHWAKRVIWIKLDVVHAKLENHNKAYVEFIATMVDHNYLSILHEKSEFSYEDEQWYYVDGVQFPTHTTTIIARNSACPCGSLRKFKNCHGNNQLWNVY